MSETAGFQRWPREQADGSWRYQDGSAALLPPGECERCDHIRGQLGPSHDGSPRCQSGSIAAGGHRSHCTCSTCW